MTIDVMHNPSPFDNDPAANESFEAMYSVIIIIVHLVSPSTIGPADQDDVVQETSIKVWSYWKTHPIYNLQAFIRQVVHTVIIDIQRRFKPSMFREFPRDESGKIREDTLQWWEIREETNPEWQVIDDEQYAETIERMADAITKLHPRQRDAAICSYKHRLDEWNRMARALEARGINTDLEWPDELTEKQRLQASFSPARRKIAWLMDEDLSEYKRP